MKRFLRVPVVAAVAVLVAASAASAVTGTSTVAPSNASAPTISGEAAVGSTLTANPGTWRGSAPITFQYQWRICDGGGGSCHDIAGATGQTYQIRNGDQGNTLRVHVIASNADGSRGATSAPTARIGQSPDAPRPVSPPTISGNVAAGSTLTAAPGGWSGSQPMSFQYQWLVCGANGDSCHDIRGATASTYQVRSADVGNTIRVRVAATNASGSGNETSAPTARVGSSPPPAPAPAPTGCPKLAAGAVAVNVTDVGSPARLQIDKFIPSGLITSSMSSFSVRFHVSDTCGQSVSGASVYATGVPYRQVSIPAETTTDSAGWVTLNFGRLAGFPASRQQQLLVMFVRARKPGDPALAGISTRRLISLPVDLRR
jgi:hypothetical protein